MHASWDNVPAATANEFRQYGLPCPPTCQTAAPSPTDGPPQLAKAGAVLATILEGVEETTAVGSAEEATTTEHMMCHLPKNPHCDVCAKAKIQRTHDGNKVVMLEEDSILAKKQPVTFGDHGAGYHLIRNEDDTEYTEVPVDTVAVVFLDRATKWIAVYP